MAAQMLLLWDHTLLSLLVVVVAADVLFLLGRARGWLLLGRLRLLNLVLALALALLFTASIVVIVVIDFFGKGQSYLVIWILWQP